MHALKLAVLSVLLSLQLPSVGLTEARSTQERVLALVGGQLIDGTGADAIENATIVTSGDRVVSVGPSRSVEIPAGAQIFDISGHSILPGFINSHVHLGTTTRYLQEWARGGVTTVRDLGYAPDRLATFLEDYDPSPFHARLVAAGPLITVPGGYPIVPFGGAWALAVTSVAQARQQAESLLDGPADILKIAIEFAGGQLPVLSTAEARAITDVAHARGTLVSAHVAFNEDVEHALAVDADDLAHMVWRESLPLTLAQRVARANVYWVPTLELWACVDSPWMAIANLRRFVDAGGQVAMGTDFAGYSCDWEIGMPMTELRYMRQAGMSPMQIIVASTRNGARVCNLEDEIGTLEAGKLADILVVDGDPLVSIEALGRTTMVIHEGHVIRNDLALANAPLLGRRSPRRSASPVPR